MLDVKFFLENVAVYEESYNSTVFQLYDMDWIHFYNLNDSNS